MTDDAPPLCLEKQFVHTYSARRSESNLLLRNTHRYGDTGVNFFNTENFYNQHAFTLNYNEEHLLLVKGKCYGQPDCSFYSAALSPDGILVPELIGDYLCLSVCLKKPDVSMRVDVNTSMSLLLNTQKLCVLQYIVSGRTAFRLMQMEVSQRQDDDATTLAATIAEKCNTKINLSTSDVGGAGKRKRVLENAHIAETSLGDDDNDN